MNKNLLAVMVAAVSLSGCMVISTHHDDANCYESCSDYEVCESYCDAWSCWDECWYETTCDTYCEETTEVTEVVSETVVGCYSSVDCGKNEICIADQCQPKDTDERGLAGLCQACSTNQDCIEPGSLCIRLNFDQASRTGEKVCSRTCEYNHDCPQGFECLNISSEVGVSAQCLPVWTEFEKRTCNPSPELECVRANDCELGESCVNNSCVGPERAECDSNRACPDGQTCRNFTCQLDSAPECARRSDCSTNQICIDGACEELSEQCVFNEECDGGAVCVDGACRAECSQDGDCSQQEACVQGLCAPLECRRSADCSAGEICVDAQCELTCDYAVGESCGEGFVCDPKNFCAPDASVECRSNAECAREEICSGGSCLSPCSCNQQCPSGQVCDLNSGTCGTPAGEPVANSPATDSCGNDCDCPSGQSCNGGTCG